MDDYMIDAKVEHKLWKRDMKKKVSLTSKLTSKVQENFNNILPKKYHEILTNAVKTMVKSVLFGYKYITKEPFENISIEEREKLVYSKINLYKKTAMAEGFATGSGGFILGMADFPLLLSIKVKLLYDIAAIYGFNVRDYKERLYILHIIQLAFSSEGYSKNLFNKMENWKEYSNNLPGNINDFDWQKFQQEYRDYLDLAKLLQLMPGIGAFIGFYVNGKLLDKLGKVAMNAYRMRLEEFK